MQEDSFELIRLVESPPPSKHTASGTGPGVARQFVDAFFDLLARAEPSGASCSERPEAMDVDDPLAAEPDVSLSHERSVESPPRSKYTASGTGPGAARQLVGAFFDLLACAEPSGASCRSMESPPPSKHTAFGTDPGVAPQWFGAFFDLLARAVPSGASCSAFFGNIGPGSLLAPTYAPAKAEEMVETAESLAISIQSELNPTVRPDSHCICIVPKPLRAVKEEAYTPTLVSIGPYHHKNSNLFPMQSRKLNYLFSFLRDSKANGDYWIYLQIIKNRGAMILEYYADLNTVEFSAVEFIEMILLDSVFIIEFFRRMYGYRKVDNDYILGRPCFLSNIKRDILLAENQLPFFILTDLFRTGFKPADNRQYATFTDMACEVLEVDKSKIDVDSRTGEAKCLHLLHLSRAHHLPSSRKRPNFKHHHRTCPSITHLFEAGVKFQAKDRAECPLLDIQFDKSKAILSIPKIVVAGDTKFELRNLIAFEQCHYTVYTDDFYISEYGVFMDCLINTTNDVELLVNAGIIENRLGSNEEVRDMYNNLGEHVNVNPHNYFYANTTRDLIAHYNRPWNRYRATLKHKYFSHPWAAISVVYAAVLLILTIAQVVTGILSIM